MHSAFNPLTQIFMNLGKRSFVPDYRKLNFFKIGQELTELLTGENGLTTFLR